MDANVTEGQDQILGTSDDITQIPGVFTCYGCTITLLSPYTVSGSYATSSSTSLVISFTRRLRTP